MSAYTLPRRLRRIRFSYKNGSVLTFIDQHVLPTYVIRSGQNFRSGGPA